MKILILMAALSAAFASTAEIKPLTSGETIPAATLKTADGADFDLQTAIAEQPTILIFYRGGWCPYCNRHLAALQDLDPQLRELGYQIIAISPDQPSELAKSAEGGHLSYTLLSDSKVEAATAFGLVFTVDDATIEKYKKYDIDLEASSGESHHMLPVPAVFIVGTDGVIDFAHADADYKKRIESEVLLNAAKAAR
ncbi:peroxiredoxin-like family protein [Pontiellaceae bacterium B12219]|nr:peroxiredoxin-like family protein [Pontiellaceae bacterium B12219]